MNLFSDWTHDFESNQRNIKRATAEYAVALSISNQNRKHVNSSTDAYDNLTAVPLTVTINIPLSEPSTS